MFDSYTNMRQDRMINHLQDKIDGLRMVTKMGARATAYEVSYELNRKLNKLILMNMALIELIDERTNISIEDINKKIAEIDLRDGEMDGRINEKAAQPPAKDCPKCDAKISRDFNRCLFCGYEDIESNV